MMSFLKFFPLSLGLIFTLLCLKTSLAEETDRSFVVESNYDYTQRVKKKLDSLKTLGANDYFTQIDKFRTTLEKYIDHKKRVCNGEFSTVIFEAKTPREGRKKRGTNKLTKEEKALCYRELKAFQVNFINNMFEARKNYLDFLHSKRIKELAHAREKSIQSLHRTFSSQRR